MDKAEPEDKKLPGHYAQRCDDANLGGYVLLPAIGVHQVPDTLQGVAVLPARAREGDTAGQIVTGGFTESQYVEIGQIQAQGLGTAIALFLTGQL